MQRDRDVPSLSRRPHVFACILGAMGAVCLVGTLFVPPAQRPLLVAAGSIALVALPILQLMLARRRLAAWGQVEQQLIALGSADGDDAESGEVNTVTLHGIPVGDACSRGWNRLVVASETWNALHDLEASVSEKLRHSGRWASETVLNNIGEGVAVTDLDGKLTVINDALTALIHNDERTELHGRNLLELLGHVAPQATEELQDDLAATSRPASVDLEMQQNGTRHILRCIRRPQFSRDSELVGHVWTLRDVTQQRLAEDMREQFVSTASHELRTPLANIKAYAETLVVSDGIDVEKQKEFCNTIQTEATRLGRFVDDLLEVTRMQAGSLSLDKRETDIARLLEEVCDKLKGQMEQKDIDFQSEFPAKLPKLTVDKDKVFAALVNLLGNAVKYTPEGGQVRFRVETEDPLLSFSVEDTGIGIAPGELEKVFDKFYRSEDERVRSTMGSGLGLAFTKEVARLHGGDVTVHSELNKGTRFTLSIPLGDLVV